MKDDRRFQISGFGFQIGNQSEINLKPELYHLQFGVRP